MVKNKLSIVFVFLINAWRVTLFLVCYHQQTQEYHQAEFLPPLLPFSCRKTINFTTPLFFLARSLYSCLLILLLTYTHWSTSEILRFIYVLIQLWCWSNTGQFQVHFWSILGLFYTHFRFISISIFIFQVFFRFILCHFQIHFRYIFGLILIQIRLYFVLRSTSGDRKQNQSSTCM